MALFISSLNSGSNGNCYYVGNEREAVLIDAGISCRETEKRMGRLGLSLEAVKAIFVSHEHSDHIRGLVRLAKKYQLPVYITPRTLNRAGLPPGWFPILPFRAYEPLQVGSLSVTAFPKRHDAADPHSFVVTGGDVRVGVFTDIGVACENVIEYFSQCHAAFLEANYEEALLEGGRYPAFLKRRIRGGSGHLSNGQALDLFRACKPDYMSHLLLSHLSAENNCPSLTRELFMPHAGSTEIVVASRSAETPVYAVGAAVPHF
ncbi:MAG: Metal-dependent hydrolases of the beta-lactamase superfamily I [uncultured Cytophagales bacterium]|uniref:Metal-dependent hydrolases of the beta-lactamase superfamily I n=1 Tax=uncultured Cytophagales bacterium TaxID=158755 RepID=A0A6J4LLB4_9SPHI|nr:MAG: Metal-dependent hydrolases of the beta-lactamase superfamily I [uncultured Cytophagales bacterium]